jgi:hypothetical protein
MRDDRFVPRKTMMLSFDELNTNEQDVPSKGNTPVYIQGSTKTPYLLWRFQDNSLFSETDDELVVVNGDMGFYDNMLSLSQSDQLYSTMDTSTFPSKNFTLIYNMRFLSSTPNLCMYTNFSLTETNTLVSNPNTGFFFNVTPTNIQCKLFFNTAYNLNVDYPVDFDSQQLNTFALVYNGDDDTIADTPTKTFSIYVNGQQLATQTLPSTMDVAYPNNGVFRIVSFKASDYMYIDELAVYDSVLTTQEISDYKL